jgi:hypothetical protein
MGFLHVLLAVALTLGVVSAGWEVAAEDVGSFGVLVVHVAITLFLSRPTDLVVLAVGFGALPGTRVGLFMLGQVAGTLEHLVAVSTLLVDVHGRCILLATSHGALNAFVRLVLITEVDGALEGSRDLSLIG